MGKTLLVDLLDELEQVLEHAKKVPLTGKVMVDAQAILEKLDQVRINLPEQIKQAEWVLSERDRIVGEARRAADGLLQSADQKLRSLIKETEVVKAAEREANRILEEGRAEAKRMRDGAEEFAEKALADLEEVLQKVLKSVRRGREELQRS